MASLLVGGISFYTSEDIDTAPPVATGQVFTLYENRDSAAAATFSYREYYLLYFQETVRGLSAGAPVDFYGIKVGEVISIRLLFDQDKLTFRIPVLIAIEPDRIELSGELAIPEYQVMEKLVEKGLRAQQRLGNLLTGQSYVSMRIHPAAEPEPILTDDIYPVLPTIPNTVEEITATAKRLLDRFNNLPLEETLEDIRKAAAEVEAMTGSEALESAIDNIDESFAEFKKVTSDLNDGTLPKVNGMLDQAKASLARGEEALATANVAQRVPQRRQSAVGQVNSQQHGEQRLGVVIVHLDLGDIRALAGYVVDDRVGQAGRASLTFGWSSGVGFGRGCLHTG